MKLEEIAKLAGVSVSTASVALSGKKGVSEKTRKHIIAVAQENNYIPLRDHSHHTPIFTVHFVTCQSALSGDVNYMEFPLFQEIIKAFNFYVIKGKFNFQCHNIRVNDCVKQLQELSISPNRDWVVVHGISLTSKVMNELQAAFPRIIFYENYNEKVAANFVSTNSYQSGFQVGKYLSEHKLGTVGYVTASSFSETSFNLTRGFKDGLKIGDITLLRGHEFVADSLKIESGHNPFKETFQLGDLPKVLFCENPMVTANTINLLTALNLNIGTEIAIVGVDSCRTSLPKQEQITSIGTTGQTIVDSILHIIEDENTTKHICLTPKLTEGGTTLNKSEI